MFGRSGFDSLHEEHSSTASRPTLRPTQTHVNRCWRVFYWGQGGEWPEREIGFPKFYVVPSARMLVDPYFRFLLYLCGVFINTCTSCSIVKGINTLHCHSKVNISKYEYVNSCEHFCVLYGISPAQHLPVLCSADSGQLHRGHPHLKVCVGNEDTLGRRPNRSPT